eukprot:5919435-Alexandrium_andersonii.AAC.1
MRNRSRCSELELRGAKNGFRTGPGGSPGMRSAPFCGLDPMVTTKKTRDYCGGSEGVPRGLREGSAGVPRPFQRGLREGFRGGWRNLGLASEPRQRANPKQA